MKQNLLNEKIRVNTMNRKNTVRVKFIGALTMLLSLIVTPFTANAENWQDIGWGTLIDGWILDKNAQDYPLTVMFQKDVDSEFRYRIWQPYKDLNTVAYNLHKGSKTSHYYNVSDCIESGQIVFDISNTKNVTIDSDKYAGFKPGDGKLGFSGVKLEFICSNYYTYYQNLNGMGDMMANMYDAYSYYDEESHCVVVPKALTASGLTEYSTTNGGSTAKIIFPEGYDVYMPSPEEKEYDAANWTPLGMGKLIDGWVTNGETFDVEIHQSKTNPNLYRVWEPYKNLTAQTGMENKSEFCGQIVFDVSNPDYVYVKWANPVGYYNTQYNKEVYAFNYFAYLVKDYNGPDSNPAYLEYIAGKVDEDEYSIGETRHSTYDADTRTVYIGCSFFGLGTSISSGVSPTFRPSTIILPKQLTEEEKWEMEDAEDWVYYDEAQFVDAWVNPGQCLKVEVQNNIHNEYLYRIWAPFNSLAAVALSDGDTPAKSAYQGQIIIDTTDRDNVLVKFGKPAGAVYDGDEYSGEMYILNELGYWYEMLKTDDPDGDAEALEMAKMFVTNPSYMDEFDVLHIPAAQHTDAEMTEPITTDHEATLTLNSKILTGVSNIATDTDNTAPAVYYNLQGIRVDNPTPGQILIRKQGSKASKLLYK